MAFNIGDFKSRLNLGGARANLFDCQISNPFGGDDKFTFTAKAAQLPASTIGLVETFYFGRQVKMAGDRNFAEWTVTILNDEDFVVRDAMERWMNSMNTHNGNLETAGGAQGYKRDATIRQYGKAGNVIKTYKFQGLFPTEVSTIDLDWSTNDAIEEFTVTFQYDFWTANTTS